MAVVKTKCIDCALVFYRVFKLPGKGKRCKRCTAQYRSDRLADYINETDLGGVLDDYPYVEKPHEI